MAAQNQCPKCGADLEGKDFCDKCAQNEHGRHYGYYLDRYPVEKRCVDCGAIVADNGVCQSKVCSDRRFYDA